MCDRYYVLLQYSAIIEHTNKVIFLEDDDVAAVTADGGQSIHTRNFLVQISHNVPCSFELFLDEIK